MEHQREDERTDSYISEVVRSPESTDRDWVFRIADGQLIAGVKTREFQRAVTDAATMVVCAQRALNNLWQEYSYLREYCSYVGGLYNQEEFTTIAARFARPYDDISDDDLKCILETVHTSILQPLSADDLSSLANADPNRIERFLADANKGLIEEAD